MKRWLTTLAISIVLSAAMLQARAQDADDRPAVNISIVFDGPWERNAELRQLFQSEILELARREFDVRFDPAHNVAADWSRESVLQTVDRMLADPEVDLLITLGMIGSQYVATMDSLPKPVIAPVAVDAALQGLPSEGGTSGVPNLNYLAFPNTIARDLKAFRDIVAFDRVMLLVNENNFIHNFRPRVEEIAEEIGVEITAAAVGPTAASALASLPNDVEAAYVFPLFHMPSDEFDALVAGLIERRLPSFSFYGEKEVERGLMAALNPDIFPRLARRVALHTFDILLGVDPGSLPVTFLPGERLQLNMQTARAIGVYPEWSVIIEADVIHDLEVPEAVERRLTLAQAMQEGVIANLALLAEDRAVSAGEREVYLARSNLLPQLDLSATGALVDKNLAETSLGSQPQRSLRSAVTLTQVLYAEPLAANLTIQRELQEAREYDRETIWLDIARDVAVAYLDVLRAKTFERIQLENVRRTRSHLELARVRETLGQSGPAEVFRWESELATNRQNQIQASATRRTAELVLNQLLNRPLEEPFITAESEFDEPGRLLDHFRYLVYVSNPQLFNIFRNFMAREGLANAPELKAFQAAIDAQERLHASTRRAYWSPTIALQAGLNSRLASGGAGTEGLPFPPEIPVSFPEANDTHWNVGMNLSFPIFSGFAKKAQRGKASEELAKLRTERELTEDLIEQRIRASIELAGGSYGSISQAQKAADAAQRTLDLVSDAYARGAVSILNLLDAQNAALVTSEVAAGTVYDFLVDFMNVQRAIGQFDFFRTPEDLADFLARMDAYFRAAGVIID